MLARGYAIARRADDGRIVRRASDVARGDALAVRVAEGSLEVRVTDVRHALKISFAFDGFRATSR